MVDNSNIDWYARMGELKKVKYLIENGANINYTNSWKENALIGAIKNKEIEIAKYLIDSGIDINIKSLIGETPLSIAKENNLHGIINYLIEKGAK